MTRRRRALAIIASGVALLSVIQIIWWAEPAGLFGALEWLAPNVVWRSPTARSIVALSFDDGPSPVYTPEVLEILARYGAHATFFLIGNRAAAHPEVVQAIKAGGHEVGNHYIRSGTALMDGSSDFIADLDRTERAIGPLGAPKLFRPPGGLAWPSQLRMARDHGYKCVLGSAYPHDPAHPPVVYIDWLVERNLVPGNIVILHDGIPDPSRGIRALPHILEAGRGKELSFVTIGELLSGAQASAPTFEDVSR